MTPKWLYRLEATDPNNGLWYNSDSKLTWGIGKMPGCKTKFIPMSYDPRYHMDGRNWYSSCTNIEDLAHWYSLEDAKNLTDNGFVFAAYLAVEYAEYPCETCFIKDTSIKRVEITFEEMSELWKNVNN